MYWLLFAFSSVTSPQLISFHIYTNFLKFFIFHKIIVPNLLFFRAIFSPVTDSLSWKLMSRNWFHENLCYALYSLTTQFVSCFKCFSTEGIYMQFILFLMLRLQNLNEEFVFTLLSCLASSSYEILHTAVLPKCIPWYALMPYCSGCCFMAIKERKLVFWIIFPPLPVLSNLFYVLSWKKHHLKTNSTFIWYFRVFSFYIL